VAGVPADAPFEVVAPGRALGSGFTILVGATGQESLPVGILTGFLRGPEPHRRVLLVSASSKALEFEGVFRFFAALRDQPGLLERLCGPGSELVERRDPDLGTSHRVTTGDGRVREVVVIGDGYPIIFFSGSTHGAANRAMDPVMTQLFLAACGLADAADRLEPRVYDSDDLAPVAAFSPAWELLLAEGALVRRWAELNGVASEEYEAAVRPRPAAADIART
jgi:hypothetical protein